MLTSLPPNHDFFKAGVKKSCGFDRELTKELRAPSTDYRSNTELKKALKSDATPGSWIQNFKQTI